MAWEDRAHRLVSTAFQSWRVNLCATAGASSGAIPWQSRPLNQRFLSPLKPDENSHFGLMRGMSDTLGNPPQNCNHANAAQLANGAENTQIILVLQWPVSTERRHCFPKHHWPRQMRMW
jgi:hypothetical protein